MKLPRLLIIGMAAIIAAGPVIQCQAKEKDICLTQTYEDFDSNAAYPFAELIEQDDKQYKLINTFYEIVSEEPIKVSEDLTLEIKSDPIAAGEDYTPQATIEQNGVEYKLVSSEPNTTTVKSKFTSPYTRHVNYDYDVDNSEIPENIKETMEVDGEDAKVKLKLDSIEEGTSKWVDTKINILYTNYDGVYYVFGNQIIQRNDEKPALVGYESQILESLGLDTTNYKITDINWSSDPYTNNGVVYRDAIADAKMLVNGKVAVYSGTITQTQKQEMVVYTNTYEGTLEIDTGKVLYTITGTAEYEFVKDWNPAIPIAGSGGLLFFGFLFYRKRKNAVLYAKTIHGTYNSIGRVAVTKKGNHYAVKIGKSLQYKAETNNYLIRLPEKLYSRSKGNFLLITFCGSDAKTQKVMIQDQNIHFVK